MYRGSARKWGSRSTSRCWPVPGAGSDPPAAAVHAQPQNPNFVGRQKWFCACFGGDAHRTPEFDHWRWVSYWYPLGQIVSFKREVYRRALWELAARHGRLVRHGS
jgi:hypothetical protein